MGWNAARAASAWHQALLISFCLVGLLLTALIAGGCAFLVLLTQGGAGRQGTTPETRLLVGQILEYLFLLLFAGSVPFVAATLFQAGDMPLLLSSPVPPRALIGAKLLDAALANAGPSALLGAPALLGVGIGLHFSFAGWAGLCLILPLLLLIAPLITALLLLLMARLAGMRRVRAAVNLVSIFLGISLTLLAVAGASHIAQIGPGDSSGLKAALAGKEATLLKNSSASAVSFPAWLPSTWAGLVLVETAGGHPLPPQGEIRIALLALLTAVLAAACISLGPSVLLSDSFSESAGEIAQAPPRQSRSQLPISLVPMAGLLWKDLKYVVRDLVLLGQIGTSLILYLVPFLLKFMQGNQYQRENDLYGWGALFMLLVITYMTTSILALSSVGLEGRSGWIAFAAPVTTGFLLRAKWLFSGSISYGIVLILTVIAWPLFQIPLHVIMEALAVYFCTCFALSGIGVGLSGLFPRFIYENPAHRASVWALILGFVFGTGYLVLSGLIAAVSALIVTRGGVDLKSVIAGSVTGFIGFSFLVGVIPVALASKRLRAYEWEG
jgi:hypothetical protein